MSNIRGLYDDAKEEDADDQRRRDANNRYVGGTDGRGGGSGLAVLPNNAEEDDDAEGGASDAIFNIAEHAGRSEAANDDDDSNAGGATTRRTITMYRDGFLVDDGPYRRLDDPANAEFLRYLARGQTPRELLASVEEGTGPRTGTGNITVGLVDKRKEDYVETFRSFSGGGTTLGTSTTLSTAATGGDTAAATGIYDPTAVVPPADAAGPGDTTSIAVRLLDGKRIVLKVRLDGTLADLAARIVQQAPIRPSQPFRLVSGFPPTPIPHPPTASIRAAGLQGAQIQLQKA